MASISYQPAHRCRSCPAWSGQAFRTKCKRKSCICLIWLDKRHNPDFQVTCCWSRLVHRCWLSKSQVLEISQRQWVPILKLGYNLQNVYACYDSKIHYIIKLKTECTVMGSKAFVKNCIQANDYTLYVLPHINHYLSTRHELLKESVTFILRCLLSKISLWRPKIVFQKPPKTVSFFWHLLPPTQCMLDLCLQVCLLTLTVHLSPDQKKRRSGAA